MLQSEHAATLTQVQVPFWHISLGPQVCPHAPQLLLSFWTLTHVLPQQLSPLEQAGAHTFWHVPVTQICPALHAAPQLPQLPASVCVLTQEPEHTVYPAAQTQVPLWQTKLVPHAVPQVPQLLISVCMSTQVPLHVVWPEGQVAGVQTPNLQYALVAQAFPQPPQLLGSFAGSTQLPPHMISGAPHVLTQVPPEQAVPPGQALPHPPQLRLSD